MTALVPKKRGQVVVIGLWRQFADNSKYVFLHLAAAPPAGIEVRYLADHAGTRTALDEAGLPYVRYPSLRGLWYLLRCETAIVDASSWVRPLRYQVLWRARKVQLWHGCPLKRIELDDEYNGRRAGLLGISQLLIGRYPRYDLVLSPSPRFTKIAFQRAFGECQIIEGDYPRNIVFRRRDSRFMLGVDTTVVEWMEAGKREGLVTAFYLPTFRDTGGDAVSDGGLDLDRLEQYANEHGYQFLIKRHPVAASHNGRHGRSRVRMYDPRADIYPLLPACDVLITDYSSVFFDFLHTGRPIVFFAYDLEQYRRRDRSMYFDYERTVPGPICRSQADLEGTLLKCRDRSYVEEFASQRAEVLAWAFASTEDDPSNAIAGQLARPA
jgi:CDP-glycerol glycerophosphotransferase (TagB/SpsB family)